MKKIIIFSCLLVSPALAQQQPSPVEQAMSQRLLSEINSSLQCGAGLISTSAELTKAKARVKELEEKLAISAAPSQPLDAKP